MTACGSAGALMVGGRVVGQLKCDLDDGHDEPAYVYAPHGNRFTAPLGDRLVPERIEPGTPHRVVLEWEDAEPVDLDIFDPDEHFDVDVPIPAEQYAPQLFVPWGTNETEAADAAVRSALRDAYEPILDASKALNFPPTDLDRADLYGEE